MMNDLGCRYDTSASFYGKAKTISETIMGGSMLSLYSYDNMVAYIQFYENKRIYTYCGKYSQTTTRHQKEFFKQAGLGDKEIKELFKNGKLEKELV